MCRMCLSECLEPEDCCVEREGADSEPVFRPPARLTLRVLDAEGAVEAGDAYSVLVERAGCVVEEGGDVAELLRDDDAPAHSVLANVGGSSRASSRPPHVLLRL